MCVKCLFVIKKEEGDVNEWVNEIINGLNRGKV
jgi:hypothetical protein